MMIMTKDSLEPIHKAINDVWTATKVSIGKELSDSNSEAVEMVDKAVVDMLAGYEVGTKEYLLRYQMASAIETYLMYVKKGHR